MKPRQPSARHGLFCLLGWALCSALYLWTANGVVIRDDDRNNAWHHYLYLVDGFLSGHTYLSLAPAKELLALPDPWDPAQNIRYRLWDSSLYRGKYYLYFGPTPALLLMLPWKLVAGSDLPQRLATGLFACAGLGGLSLLLAGIRRRHFPAATPLQLFLAVLLAGHVSWLPVVLQRPAFWELPIVTAVALLWWCLYFLWRYHDGNRRTHWAVAAGCTLAFVVGARPTYVFGAAFIALLFALPLDRTHPLARGLRRLLPAAIPLACGIGGLLAYNDLRFGHLLEFGQRYQLWGIDEREVQHFNPAYFPFNAWLYLFSLPEVSPYFPFFRTVWPADLPAGYIATEEMPGLLFALPLHLLGAVALYHAWRRPRQAGEGALRLVLLAGAGASLLAGGILFCFAGACSRYIAELLAGWSVVTGVGLFVVFGTGEKLRHGALLRLLAGAAAVWSALCVWFASFEFRGFTRMTHPDFYRTVAEFFNYPSYWTARRTGQVYGPVSIAIHLVPAPAGSSAVLLAAGRPAMMNQLLIECLGPDQFQLRLMVNDLVVSQTPVLHTTGSELQVECHAPWLYPPAAHPFWRAYSPDPAERQRGQNLFAIGVGGTWYAGRSPRIFDATSFEPFVRTAAARPPVCAWVEKLTRLTSGDPRDKP